MSVNTLQVKENIHWIGALDKNLETFDIVMETQYGTTYNSYFIDADKKAVIDSVKEPFCDEFIQKIEKFTNPSEIEVIVVNHTEPDHSGSIARLIELAPNATIYGSRVAINYLSEIVNKPFESVPVKDGDTLSLGNKTLRFINAPNLHWPDSIYTYLEEDKLLFTCDSFGAHYCDEAMFDDLVNEKELDEAFNYYFDVILKPFSSFMLKAIEKISSLDIDVICPGHGPVLRSNWKVAVEKSKTLAEDFINCVGCEGNRVLITYVSAYGYTKHMAENIAKGIKSVKEDIEVEIIDIENILTGELESKIIKSKAILVGSPTINKNTVLPIYRLFSLLTPLRDKNKKAAVFGSYGWSGEAVSIIEANMKLLGFDITVDGVRKKFSPANEKENSLLEFGKEFAETLD